MPRIEWAVGEAAYHVPVIYKPAKSPWKGRPLQTLRAAVDGIWSPTHDWALAAHNWHVFQKTGCRKRCPLPHDAVVAWVHDRRHPATTTRAVLFSPQEALELTWGHKAAQMLNEWGYAVTERDTDGLPAFSARPIHIGRWILSWELGEVYVHLQDSFIPHIVIRELDYLIALRTNRAVPMSAGFSMHIEWDGYSPWLRTQLITKANLNAFEAPHPWDPNLTDATDSIWDHQNGRWMTFQTKRDADYIRVGNWLLRGWPSIEPKSDKTTYVGYIHGLRRWAITYGYIRGVYERWHGPVLQAECIRNPKHHPPDPKCSCGIYAMNTATTANDFIVAPEMTVLGLVRGWGRVIIASQGWRAEYAQALLLVVDEFLSDEDVRTLQHRYEVPVVTIDQALRLDKAGVLARELL